MWEKNPTTLTIYVFWTFSEGSFTSLLRLSLLILLTLNQIRMNRHLYCDLPTKHYWAVNQASEK